jgi:NADH dehydrogenase
VRSERAAAALRALPESCRPEVTVADPRDTDALAALARGAEVWVHLVGILKETRTARYADAHEGAAGIVARAAERAGVARIVYPSILGAEPGSRNPCLGSKGRAERILLDGKVPATVLRMPMVLGPDELAAVALRAQASAAWTPLVRGGATLEQPLDAGDAARALVLAAAERGRASAALDLAGPECLSHRSLVLRVAERLGTRPRVVPVPLALARLAAAATALLPEPPLTPAVLEVLEHDDCIDPEPACRRLGLALTPLDVTLDASFGRAGGHRG